jgi:RNA recognition motif-containing protein
MKHLKFIEFYDVRAAEAALRALNRIEIAGKQIKLEPGHPRFATWWRYPLPFSYFYFLFVSF